MSDATASPRVSGGVAAFDDVHALAAVLVPARSRVLDVGCGDGAVARQLVSEGCVVWGVELDKQRAEQAEAVCDRVVIADVENLDPRQLNGEPFDVVLCLDVLQHLVDPVQALRKLLGCLGDGGRVIASIPNVTHGAVRLALLDGRFAYTDSGLLDRGHLRFFDRRGVTELFEQAGMVIVEQVDVRRGLTETEIAVEPERWPPQVLEPLGDDPDVTVYQFLVSAAVAGTGVRHDRLGEQIVRTLVAQRTVIDDGAAYARRLEAKLSTRDARSAEVAPVDVLHQPVAELERELRLRIGELETAQREIAYFERANSEQETRLVAQREAIASRDKQLAEVRRALQDRQTELDDARRTAKERDDELAGARRAAKDRDDRLAGARRAMKDRGAELQDARRALKQRAVELAQARRELALTQHRMAVRSSRSRAAKEDAARLETRIDELSMTLHRLTSRRAYRLIRVQDRWRRRLSAPARLLRRSRRPG